MTTHVGCPLRHQFRLSDSHSAVADDKTPPPLPTSKAIFGVPLATVAEYGFVTSMIAGQRHDLPGVCFSTVEEIYRRGQGELFDLPLRWSSC